VGISFKPRKIRIYERYLLIRVKKESFKSNLILGFSSPLRLNDLYAPPDSMYSI